MTSEQGKWWSPTKLEVGEVRRWRIGPLSLWIQRRQGEWRIGWSQGDDPLDASLEIAAVSSVAELEAAPMLERFVQRDGGGSIGLTAALADRSLVTRPRSPFSLLEGESVQLFMSSPLWLRIVSDPQEQQIREIPFYRPSDTWFGPTTISGELGYAMQTHCRLSLEEVPWRPHRAVTPLIAENRGEGSLLLEKVCVPVPLLTLYRDEEGKLWTQEIVVRRERNGSEAAEMEILPGPPAEARGAQVVSQPRLRPETNHFSRALSLLF